MEPYIVRLNVHKEIVHRVVLLTFSRLDMNNIYVIVLEKLKHDKISVSETAKHGIWTGHDLQSEQKLTLVYFWENTYIESRTFQRSLNKVITLTPRFMTDR